MSNRKGFAAIAACAALVCAGLARASETTDSSAADSFTLAPRPVILADDAPNRKPLMSLLDKAGVGSTLDEWGIDVYGFVEGSWTYSFSDPALHLINGRIFDVEDQDPTLNQLDLTVERAITASPDKFDFGGKMEWIWGGDARFIHSNGLFDHYGFSDGPDNQFDPVQAYLTLNVPVGNGLLVTAGKFVTLMGYETINPTTNPLYSHSFLFNFAIPLTHTGIMGKYAINSDWSVTAALVRGWDQALEDNNDDPSYMGQIAYSHGDWDVYLNAITGPEQTNDNSDYRTVLDLVAVYRWSDQFTFGGNADFGWEPDAGFGGKDAVWYGAAGYMTWKYDKHVKFQGRVEWFSDHDGARGIGTDVAEVTGGLNITPCPDSKWGSGLMIRPELRYDWGSDPIYNFDPVNGSSDHAQITFAIDAIYSF